MSLFPEIIRIKIINSITGNPIPNVAIMVKVIAKHKNDYYQIPRPSNNQGIIEVTKDWIYQEIKAQQNLFLMDYSIYWEDRMEFKIMGREELSRALESMKLFKDIINIPSKIIEELEHVENANYKSVIKMVYFNEDSDKEYNLTIKTRKRVLKIF